jgi:hypothetical protein
MRKKGSNPEHSGNKLEWEFCSSLLVAKLRSWVSESASGFFEESCTHGHTAWQAFPFSFMGVAPFPNQMFGCELYSARSPTSVWPCHLTSLPVWLGMLSDNLSIVTAWPLLLPAGPLVWSAPIAFGQRSLHSFTHIGSSCYAPGLLLL